MGVLTARYAALGCVLLAACYRPSAPGECSVRCTMDTAQDCPDGTSCNADGFCHGTRVEPCTPPGAMGTFIGAGGRHTCALDADGVLRCWGDNAYGQLGISFSVPRANVPTPVEPDGTAILWDQVSVGGEHTCGLRRGDHALFCWGANYTYQLGVADDFNPRDVPTPVTAIPGAWDLVSAGQYHTCGINQGALYCWGADDEGQLGLGIGVTNMFQPTRVGVANDWVAVAAGDRHTCGIEEPVAGTRALSCWGSGAGGKLGLGNEDTQETPVPLTTPVRQWQSVSAGTAHTCAIEAATDDLYCWGFNDVGQTGPMMGNHSAPVLVDDTRAWALVSAGQRNTCGTTMTRQLLCWGSNDTGESGTGQRRFKVPLTEVSPADMWSNVSAGPGTHTCAVRQTDGALYCWGDNGFGQLGSGSFADEWTPAPIAAGATWRQVSASEWTTCGIQDDDGSLWCWGSQGDYGLVGGGTSDDAHVPVAVVVAGVTAWSVVEVALDNICAIDATGGLWCWGRNENGELGISGTTQHDTPQRVAAAMQWKAVAPGEGHVCAIAMDDSLWCWGANNYGQLGDAMAEPMLDVPGPAAVGATWVEVSSGEYNSCARSTMGGVSCWGIDRVGETGQGVTNTNVTTPQPLMTPAGMSWTASSLGAGYYGHGCGVHAGALYCWGDDSFGQLGGMRVAGAAGVPAQAVYSGSDDWTAVSAGTFTTCGLRGAGGELWCWGAADFGQTGLGVTELRDVPVHVGTGLWRSVSAGGVHACAIDDQKALWCWGRNVYGQLGDGDASRYTPQAVVQGP